jgi:hypothetical protein
VSVSVRRRRKRRIRNVFLVWMMKDMSVMKTLLM